VTERDSEKAFLGMTLFEKAIYAVAAAAALLIVGLVVAYWWAGQVPGRPKGVAPNAVFLWAPHVGFPGPRRGWWLSCSEDVGHNRCRLSDVDGNTEYDGEFVPYGDKGSVPADQLKIDPEKTRDNKVWIGSALVPLVFLQNGRVLIPANKYQEGARLLEQLKPNH
jgi:hypothetical protein